MATTYSHAIHDSHESHSKTVNFLVLIGFIVACHAAGLVGTLFGNQGFYQELRQPSWAPPSSLFGPAWTVLYTLMGTAGFLLWKQPASPARRTALIMFGIQLFLNAIWTPIFFGAEQIGLAFAVIFVTVFVIGASTVLFWKVSRAASYLFVPYLSWVSYAMVLNYALWRLN